MSEEQNIDELFQLGDNQTSLANLLGMDIQTIEEVRGAPITPSGQYELTFAADEIPAFVFHSKADPETGETINQLKVRITAKITNIYSIADGEDPLTWVNRQHTEFSFPIRSIDEFKQVLGRVKAIAVDAGIIDRANPGDVNTMFRAFAGRRLVAVINKRINTKNGFESSRINERKVQPAEEEAAVPVAQVAGAGDDPSAVQ